jgi:hypothetical protein
VPNIVAELIVELARVQELLPKLEGLQLEEARATLRYGREQMAMNSYEGMSEALSELREFGRPKKAEPEK